VPTAGRAGGDEDRWLVLPLDSDHERVLGPVAGVVATGADPVAEVRCGTAL